MKGGQGHSTTEMDSKASGVLWTPVSFIKVTMTLKVSA